MRGWLILLSYFGASFINGLAWATLIPVPDKAMSYYQIGQAELTLYSYIFSLLSIFLAPISLYIIFKSLFLSMHMASLANLLGCWIRFLARDNFWLSFLGQTTIASTNILILSSCSTMATLWFPQKYVILATSIATSANFLGIGFGYVYMPYSMNIGFMMFLQALVASTFWIINLVVMKKNKPVERTQTLKKSISLAAKEPILIAMTACSGSAIGVNYSIVCLFGLLFEEEGYSKIQTGWVSFAFLFSGLAGGLFATYLAEVKKSTKNPLQIFLVLSIISSFLFAAIVRFESVSYVAAAIYGACLTGFIPLSIRVAVEYSNEIEEEVPTNIIYLGAQVFSCIYTYPIQFCKTVLGFSGFWAAAVLILISFASYILIIRKSKGSLIDKQSFYAIQVSGISDNFCSEKELSTEPIVICR